MRNWEKRLIIAEDQALCEKCRSNYQRTKCDRCGKKLCLHCASAPNEVLVCCKGGCQS